MNDDRAGRSAPGVMMPSGRDHGTELTSKDFSAAEHREKSFAPHSHEGDQLYWFPDGGMDVVVSGRRWLVHSDTVVWIPAGIVHSSCLLGPGTTLSIYLSPTLRPPGERWQHPLAIALDPLVGEIMRHLPARSLPPRRRLHCYRLLVDLLTEAEDRGMAMPVPVHPVARSIAEAVLADPGDPTELRQWAQQMHVSTRTIARAFVAETGHGFSSWRTKARLLAALPQLMEGAPVHRVAEGVGYGSVGGFIAAFAKEFGSPPAAYVRDRR